MESRNDQPIDELFSEKKGQNSSENLMETENRSNYFNDFTGGTKIQSPYVPSQTQSERKNQEVAQKGDCQMPEQSGYFDNSQKENFGRKDGVQNCNNTSDPNKYFALGVVSTILGITSIFSSILMGIAIVLSIIGLVLSIVRMSVKADGFSIAGLITSTIGFLLNALFLIAFISVALNPTGSAVVLQSAFFF